MRQSKQQMIIMPFLVDKVCNIFRQIMIGDIKKMSLSYAKCPAGDLHNGQILSLVCVDVKCTKRGLICPICRMMNHQEHQVLPLKIFIDQVKKSFLQSEDNQSLNNLSDYLRSLDQSKKQLLNILRETAENIAKQLKKVQQKIQQNYIAIRKNILAQSTMSTKLPIFIQNLVKKQENDPHWLQQEFQRYSELIKYDKSTIQISDKAKKIVEDYSLVPTQINALLKEQTQKIKNGFKELFSDKAAAKVAKKSQGYIFSVDNKHSSLKLTDDKKELYAPEVVDDYGLAYVKDEIQGNKKITFRIVAASSGNIILGMGRPNMDKQLAFMYSSPVENQHFCLNSDGYYEDPAYKQESISQDGPNSFYFHETGAEVTINFENDKNQITFTKGGSGESKVLPVKLSAEEKKQLCFFVSLGENDRVRIVQSQK